MRGFQQTENRRTADTGGLSRVAPALYTVTVVPVVPLPAAVSTRHGRPAVSRYVTVQPRVALSLSLVRYRFGPPSAFVGRENSTGVGLPVPFQLHLHGWRVGLKVSPRVELTVPGPNGAVAVIVTFCTGILLVPSLTTAIFSGQGGQASFPGLNRFLRR